MRDTALQSCVRIRSDSRKGSMLVLLAGLLTFVLAMVVFTVDVSFMQLTRSELRVATDAAAKAAVESLTRTDGNTQVAVSDAIAIASQNTVAGNPLVLTSTDFVFGRTQQNQDGTWAFLSGQSPYTAVQVTSEKSSQAASGPVNLFFAPIFGTDSFTPQATSTAAQFEQKLVLCIDRSHSMCFDESGIAWSYPTSYSDDDDDDWQPSYDPANSPPHATLSRWASIEEAVQLFVDTVKVVNTPPEVALVTWASSTTDPGTGQSLPAATWDVGLTSTYDSVMTRISDLGDNVMPGQDNMAAGIDQARYVLNNCNDPSPYKAMVLFSDGSWDEGRSPLDAAQDAFGDHIVIHTISFLPSANQGALEQIATITGGQFYHASDRAQLRQVFEELALTLPIALTD